jgi:hypothetical protein
MKKLFPLYRTFSGLKAAVGCVIILLLLFTACSGKKQIFENAGDIGACKIPGSFTYDKGKDMYTLTGSGYDMWFEIDEFFMVWKEVTGDFKLSAKIAFEGEGVHQLRKMGLIIRESLEADARHANVALHGSGLTALQYRLLKGGETLEMRSTNQMPDHVILERSGNKIMMKTGNGKYSEQAEATLDIFLSQTCYVGLFICSHEVDLLETGYFTNVRLE